MKSFIFITCVAGPVAPESDHGANTSPKGGSR